MNALFVNKFDKVLKSNPLFVHFEEFETDIDYYVFIYREELKLQIGC